MGLKSLFGVASTPSRSDVGQLRVGGGYGHLFAIDLVCRCGRAYEQLKELHNASRSDLRAFAESTKAVYKLAQELDAVDAALLKGSHGALDPHIDKHKSFILPDTYGASPGMLGNYYFTPLEFNHHQVDSLADSWAKRWVEENVDGPQRQDFLDLLERHDNLAQATYEAWRGFRDTTREIERAVEKQRTIDAAASVDADAGARALPEIELSKVQEARGLVSSISAGLDEAYAQAKPRLEALDETPGPFALPRESAGVDLGR